MQREQTTNRFDKRMGFFRFYNIQKVLPAVYDDSLSYYELLAKLQCSLQKLTEYFNMLADYQDVQDDNLQATRQELIDYTDAQISELHQLIDLLESSSLDWDVQHGYYIDSQDAMRDMFNDVTVHAITVGELNELDMTVDSLAECGLNVRGLAVMSYWLKSAFDLLPEYQPQPSTGNRLTVDKILGAEINKNGVVFIPQGD